MYNRLYEYFTENELISSSVSDFKPVYQSVDIYYSWYISIFWQSFEVRGVFFDISKAFDRVWHKKVLLT